MAWLTLTLAWVRSQGDVEELIVASDSRLRGGHAWDAAPKILPLPRGDAVVAFAGATEFAYPMMLQAANAISGYRKALDRRQPLEDMKGHIVRVFNHMLTELRDPPRPQELQRPDALFLIAGYSWKTSRFRIWTVHFDASIGGFTFRPAVRWRGGNDRKVLTILGDNTRAARDLLMARLREARRLSTGGFDWEPLEVLAQLIRDQRFTSIGGFPQVVKVYKSMQVVPFAVPWRDSKGKEIHTVLGRPLLDYEVHDLFPLLTGPNLGV